MNELYWEITREEHRTRREKTLKASFSSVFLFGVMLFLGVVFNTKYCDLAFFDCIKSRAMIGVWMFLIFPIATVYFFYLTNKINNYPKRTYLLTKETLTITKGSKSKTYFWKEFSCFYVASFIAKETLASQPQNETVAAGVEFENAARQINGQKFLLKTQPLFGLIPRFVVIYAEPDNGASVKEFIESCVQELPTTISTGSFARYEFN